MEGSRRVFLARRPDGDASLTSPELAGVPTGTLDMAAVIEAVRAPGDGYVAVDASLGLPLAALLALQRG